MSRIRVAIVAPTLDILGGHSVQAESAYSGPIGIVLVGAGLVAVVVSTLRFFQARDQIAKGRYEPAAFPEVVVVVFTLIAGAALIVYLALSGR